MFSISSVFKVPKITEILAFSEQLNIVYPFLLELKHFPSFKSCDISALEIWVVEVINCLRLSVYYMLTPKIAQVVVYVFKSCSGSRNLTYLVLLLKVLGFQFNTENFISLNSVFLA